MVPFHFDIVLVDFY